MSRFPWFLGLGGMAILPDLAGRALEGSDGALATLAQVRGAMAPLPASPPIGGVLWTVVVPAALFAGSFLGTFLLYRRFSGLEEEE